MFSLVSSLVARPCVSPLALALLVAGLSTDPSAAAVSILVVDAAGNPVPDAVVSLRGGQAASRSDGEAVMDQVDKQFVPRVLPVKVGTSVSFPNGDDIRHHVYSFSPSKTFEIRLYSGTPRDPVVFDEPGVVTLGCNIHDWMVGFVVVVDSEVFAKTGLDGTADLALEAGRHTLEVWHPWLTGMGAGSAEHQAFEVEISEIADGSPVTLTVELQPPSVPTADPADSSLESKFRRFRKNGR